MSSPFAPQKYFIRPQRHVCNRDCYALTSGLDWLQGPSSGMSTCRLGVANGEKVIKAKALERLKGDSEAAEQRKKVTVRLSAIFIISSILQDAAHWMRDRSSTCRAGGSRVKDAKRVRGLTEGQGGKYGCGCADGVREAIQQQGPGELLQGPVPAGARQEHRCGERHPVARSSCSSLSGHPTALLQRQRRCKYGIMPAFAKPMCIHQCGSPVRQVIGRSKEVARVVQVLARRSKNNPILLGDPGVGKTAIAEGLARAVVTGEVALALAHRTPETLCGRQGLGVVLVDKDVRSGEDSRPAEHSPDVTWKATALPECLHGAQGRCRTAQRCLPSSGASA